MVSIKDIDKAIRFYKEASSFNDQYSKNNLGYLFRMQNKINYSIELFKEAIYQNDDVLASYNLANIYFYDGIVKDNINEAMKILILPSKRNFYPAQLLLSLALISKVGFDINIIKKEIDEIVKSDQFSANIINIIQTNKLNSDSEYEFFNTFLSNIFILYNYSYCAIESFKLFKEEPSNKTNLVEINSKFYEGFGF